MWVLACVLAGVREQAVIKVPKVSGDAFSCKKQKLQLILFLQIAMKSFHMTWQEIPKQGRSKTVYVPTQRWIIEDSGFSLFLLYHPGLPLWVFFLWPWIATSLLHWQPHVESTILKGSRFSYGCLLNLLHWKIFLSKDSRSFWVLSHSLSWNVELS